MELGLKGRTVVVTGASMGIGRAIVTDLVDEGANVAALARRAEPLEALARDLDGRPGQVFVRTCDVTSDASRQAAYAAVMEHFGDLDVLVNNAGYSAPLAVDADDQPWRDSFEINFFALRLMTDLVLPRMLERGRGGIVNVTGATEPISTNASLAAKAAVHAWAKGLSRDVAARGVTVNNVVPGRIHSEQIDERLYADPAVRDAFIRDHIPIGYFGDPADLSALVVFLASERGRYITGQTVAVDGGMQRRP